MKVFFFITKNMFTKGRLLQASLSSSEKKKKNTTKPNLENKRPKQVLLSILQRKKNLFYYSDINAINYLIQ